MNKQVLWGLGSSAILLSVGFQSLAVAEEVYVADAVADASVAQGQPVTNFGSENVLVVGEAGGEWRGFIKWDFAGADKVPQGSTITSVAIQLNRQCTSSTSGIFMEVGTVNEDWAEGSVRWGTRPEDISPLALYPLASCSGGPEWIELVDTSGDLRDRIQALVDAGSSGYGIELKASPPATDAYQLIRSREDTPPRLVITYEDVQPGAADLSVVSVESDPGPIGLCEPSFHTAVTIQNVGDAASSGATISIKLGLNTDCGQTLYSLLNSVPLVDIEAGGSAIVELDVPIPPIVNRQDYFVFAEIGFSDATSENNCGHTSEAIEFERCADLAVSDVQTQSAAYQPGDQIHVSFALENAGGILSDPPAYSVYLSDDLIIGGDKQVWGPYVLGSGISPYTTTTQSVDVILDGSVNPGLYYIGVVVEDDGAFNDQSLSSMIVIQAPCPADFTHDGVLDIFDVFAFLDAFKAHDPIADLNDDTMFDVFDVFAYLDLYNAGCP